MNDFGLSDLGFDATHLSAHHISVVLGRLVVAALLGSVIAYRVWRKVIPGTQPPSRETAQAQTLIAVAGAIMISVIGDSVARAFGLVGLGAFIRFRSGIKDPRDAAVMFVMIGIGMACGLSNIPMAVVATAFVCVTLAVFDATGKGRMRRIRVTLTLDDPTAALAGIRAAFPIVRVLDLPSAANGSAARIVIEVEVGDETDAASIADRLRQANVAGVKGVALEEAKGP